MLKFFRVGQIVPTGNNQEDEINKQRFVPMSLAQQQYIPNKEPHRLRDELARLQRNKERRELRERQKRNTLDAQVGNPMSPNDMSPDDTIELKKRAPGKGTTNRKCANCGQTGHIRKHYLDTPNICYTIVAYYYGV